MATDRFCGGGAGLLVAAPNWLGDVVMAAGLLDGLARLKRRHGQPARLVVALRRAWLPLLQNDTRLDALLPVERPGAHDGWRGVARLAASWRRARCDAVLLLPPSLRVALAAGLAGIPRRVGYRGDGRGWLLTDAVTRPSRGAVHHADELLELGRVWARGAGLEWPADGGAAENSALPGLDGVEADARLTAGAPAWAMGMGASYGDAKAWPARRAAELIDRLVTEEGARVLVLGDAAAAGAAREASRTSRAPWRRDPAGGPGAVDLTGRTSLAEAIALLKGAAAFVGNDSGLMHLAAALGVPTVGIFGATDPSWTGPRGAHTAVVAAAGFPCSPCFLRRCPRDLFCLDTVDAPTVLEAARSLVARAGSGRRSR